MSEEIEGTLSEPPTLIDVPSTTKVSDKGQEEGQEGQEEDEGFDLLLGDVIKLHAPQNDILNEQTFFIKYIDERKISLVNIATSSNETLHVDEDGVIDDASISEIELIYRQKELGFSRQNGLLPNTWINLSFGGDIPSIITAEITNLEGDMIEITTYPEKRIFYIPFNYKGMPENMFIDKIEIRKPPEEMMATQTAPSFVDQSENLEPEQYTTSDVFSDDDEFGRQEEDDFSRRRHEELLKNIVTADRMVMGEIHESVDQFVEITEKRKRYNINAQKDEILESMLSMIPTKSRTSSVMSDINTQIERYAQLRAEYSEFDKNGVVKSVLIRSHLYKPLKRALTMGENKLHWLLFGVKNTPKFYYLDNPGADYSTTPIGTDPRFIEIMGDLTAMEEALEGVITSASEQNKYIEINNVMDPFCTPFNDATFFAKDEEPMIHIEVKNDMTVVLNDDGNYKSETISKNVLNTKQFLTMKYNTGLTRLDHIPIGKKALTADVVDMTPPDKMAISSIITLPISFILFSKINLPGTNMLTRSNLNALHLNYWQILTKKTRVKTIQLALNQSKEEMDIEEKEKERLERERKKEQRELELARPKTKEDFDEMLANIHLLPVDNKQPSMYLNYFNTVNSFIPQKDDVSILSPEGTIASIQQKREKYDRFLEKMIPTTKEIFNIMSTYINERVSLIGVVETLEPFLIYSKHLTFKQYQMVTNFIDCKISKYNKLYRSNQGYYNGLLRLKSTSKVMFPQAQTIYKMIGADDAKHNVFNNYGYMPYMAEQPLSNSELLKKILMDDYANVYNIGASLWTTHLSYPVGLSPLFDTTKDEFKQMISNDRSKSTCTNYVLSKKYRTKLELDEDNGVEIYYDKIFDKTPYAVLENYEKDQRNMPANEFFEFLVTKLIKKYKYTDEEAAMLAQSLIDGLKKVNEGDYAVFFSTVTNKFEYYFRKSNNWVYDEKASTNLFVSDPNILCNLQTDCVYADAQINGLCESIDTVKDITKDTMLSSIVSQFDTQYIKSKEERDAGLKAKFEYYSEVNTKLKSIKYAKHVNANKMQYDMGLTLVDTPESIASPYKKIIDIILGLSDVFDRNTNIIKFTELCTRESFANKEDDHWLYCLKTDTKLIPVFIKQLAQTFISNNAEYDNVLQKIKKDIGVLSDDGDKIVDMYSGIEIDKIRFSTAEGHDNDGFQLSSRGVLEEDWGDNSAPLKDTAPDSNPLTTKSKDVIMTPETKIIHLIISAISTAMGVHIPTQMEFIVRNVKTTLIELLYSEEEHDIKNEALLKKGKPIVPYEDHKNGILLYLTLGMFIIAVQSNVPSIKTRKTYPGCNSSLKGYPLGVATDLDFINYLACVVYKTRIASGPWKVLMKKKEDYIASAIFSYIDQYLLKTQEITQKIKDKQLYLYELSLAGSSLELEEAYGTSHMDGFLPPLKSFSITHLNGVTTEFEESLLNNLKTGSHNQNDQIIMLQSKIITFSLALQEEIQYVIDDVVTKSLKKTNSYDLLISYGSQLALENACCNDDVNNKVLQYFTEKSDKIDKYNKIVDSYSQIMLDIKFQTTARQFFSIVNTKNSYPQIGVQFNQTTIYKAFITYCNFLNKKTIPEKLRHICAEKPVGVRKSDSIKDQIKKIENEGKTFTPELMSELLLVVSKQHIVGTSIAPPVPTKAQQLRNLLEQMQESITLVTSRIIPLPLQKLMMDVLDAPNNTDESAELRALRNYILGANKNIKKTIITFITKHASLTKDKINEFTSFLNTIANWSDNRARNKLNMTDGDLHNSLNFIKTYLHNFVQVFPNIILTNKPDKFGKKFRLPKHWGVNGYDEVTIKTNVIDYYSPLDAFFKNEVLMQPLLNIQRNLETLTKLADATPCVSTMTEDGAVESLGVFDKDTSMYLFEYYFLSTINEYIEETSAPQNKKRSKLSPPNSDAIGASMFSAEVNDSVVNFEVDQEREYVEQISEGVKKHVKTGVAKLLTVYMDMMLTHKLTINVSYSYIMENVFKIQRAETRTFTERLERLEDDEREADTALKTLKLGRWNLGLQKSLTTYNKNDVNVEALENNQKYQGIENAVRMNKRNEDITDIDQAVVDYIEDAEAEELEQAELGMAGIGEDYDDGDPYGDEYNAD